MHLHAGGAWQTTLEKHPLPEPDGTLGPQPMYTMLLQVPLDVSGLTALGGGVFGFLAAFGGCLISLLLAWGVLGADDSAAWVLVQAGVQETSSLSLSVCFVGCGVAGGYTLWFCVHGENSKLLCLTNTAAAAVTVGSPR